MINDDWMMLKSATCHVGVDVASFSFLLSHAGLSRRSPLYRVSCWQDGLASMPKGTLAR